MIVAIIDIGTNTTRLLVKDSETGTELTREIALTRLGQGIENTGKLLDEAMTRTRLQVEEYVEKAKKFEAKQINVFATAGCRNSSNGKDFINTLNDIDAVKAIVIDGNYEANASFAGAVSGFSFEDSPLPLAVIDIGGGSTEIGVSSLTDVSKCESYVSIPIGSSRLTERYLHSDPPKPEELTNAIRDVRDSISDAISSNNVLANAKTFIGVAATFTTVGAIEIGLTKFNFDKLHGFVLTREMIEEIFRTLATEDLETRKFNPGLDPERADLIVGGICILVAIMRQLDLAQITISCTDLLDGLYNMVLDN